MKVAVWGAGSIGSGLVRRLATLPSVSEIHWINRSPQAMEGQAIDIQHGLALMPSCHTIERYKQEGQASKALEQADALVLTLGASVKQGGSRADLYPENCKIYLETVCLLVSTFPGVVVVITNPVDLLTRLIYKARPGLRSGCTIGLGTLVETLRLRAALSDHLSPRRRPSDLPAFAVGTHDENFVMVAERSVLAPHMPEEEFKPILKMVKGEVTNAAQRVKESGTPSTLHPIVEGAVHLLDTIATDRRTLLTVSVLDPDDKDGLCCSVPCVIGRDGVIARCAQLVRGVDMSLGKEAMRKVITAAS